MRIPSPIVQPPPQQQADPLAIAAAGFGALSELVDEAFCIIDVIFDEADLPCDYRFVMVSPTFEAQTGLRDALGKRIRDMAPAHERHWFDIYGEVARTGRPVRFTQVAQALGRWFEVKAAPVRGMPGNHVAVLFRDITPRMRAEDDLRMAEMQARLAVEIAQLGTFRYDPVSALVKLDAGMLRMWGEPQERGVIPVAEMLARIHPDDRPGVEAAISRAMDPMQFDATQGRYAIDYRICRRDGVERWIAGNGQVEFDAQGAERRAIRVVGTVLDISERKLAEAALRDADVRKDEFLATLAHELRNPLATIRNTLRINTLHMQGLPAPDGGVEDAARVRAMLERQVDHMVHLIDDLMEISRISHGTIDLELAQLDLGAVVVHAVEAARPATEQAGLALSLALPQAELPVVGDAVRLGQVLGNLLANAVRYTDRGGRIDVRASRHADRVEVAIADSGIGIAADKLPGLFALFGQLDRADPRAEGGLGIGLALARRLARQHGGDVTAFSAGCGRGSTFVLTLAVAARPGEPHPREPHSDEPHSGEPRPKDTAGATAGPDAAGGAGQESGGSAPRVLVVDDNHDAADSAALLLSVMGVETRTAYGGEQALAMLARDDIHALPDIVLLDLGMPGMDGYETARRIRANPDWSGVKLVALTGWGQDADMQRTREAGFDHHLVKPMRVEALMAWLQPGA